MKTLGFRENVQNSGQNAEPDVDTRLKVCIIHTSDNETTNKRTTTMTQKLRIDGNTKPHKEVLKARGFSWNPEQRRWWTGLTDWQAGRILDPATREEEWASLKWLQWRECRICIGQTVIWQSQSYGATDAIQHDTYACDAAGNYCPGKQIPGSAPDDTY